MNERYLCSARLCAQSEDDICAIVMAVTAEQDRTAGRQRR